MHTESSDHLTKPDFEIYALNEQAITLYFGNEISEVLADRIWSFNNILHQTPFPGFKISVPAYNTLTVFYNLLVVSSSDLPGITSFDQVSGYLQKLNTLKKDKKIYEQEKFTIPVYYGGDFGPDLYEVSLHTKLSNEEIISLHSAIPYKVYMIGFIPGFAYLGGMDERLATPRKAIPRNSIPAGAVGIAGEQTGIYPLKTPGGWQIIGQTPVKLFDAQRKQPSLLKAGDEVVFKPITLEEFDYLLRE